MIVPRRLSHTEYHALILGPLDVVVQQLERDGVCISPTKTEALARAGDEASAKLVEKLTAWTGKDVNWNSTKQVQAFLHDDLGLPKSPYYKKGAVKEDKVSTDDRALEWLIDHCPEQRANLQLIRDLRKAKRTARDARKWLAMATMRDGGAYATLHPSFGLASDDDNRPGARTGRFAVKNPPLNGVASPDRDVFQSRSVFIAPPGYFVIACDAAQLEVVLGADKATRLFGTTILADRLRAREDMHNTTARFIFGDVLGDEQCKAMPSEKTGLTKYQAHWRGQSKAVRYGVNYCKSGYGFGSSLFDVNGDALGEEKGDQIVEAFYSFEPELRMLHDFGHWWTKNKGFTSSLLGRWTRLDGHDSRKQALFNKARRKEANYYMQATGQEVLALALIACANDPALRLMGFRLELPVHDEIVGIVLERHAAEATAIVQSHITGAIELLAPLGASGGYGPDWAVAGGK